MNRREFLAGLAGTIGSFTLPGVAAATAGLRPPPRVASFVLWDDPRHYERGPALSFCTVPGAARKAGALVELSLGDRLALHLLSVNMGHHSISARCNGREVRRFESPAIGALLERGEPLCATVAAIDGRQARVDVRLDRPVRSGERIALLDPVLAARGVRARLLQQDDALPHALGSGWRSLQSLPWYQPVFRFTRNPYWRRGDSPNNRFEASVAHATLRPVPQRQRAIYLETPWAEFHPGLSLLTHRGRLVAYVNDFGASADIGTLHRDGERVEARLLGPGGPGELMVDLSLLA